MLRTFYPRIYKENLDPTKAYRQYVQTYIERDLRELIHIKDLTSFQTFMRLCAGRVGQIINYSNMANELGVSHHTVREWLSLLEASFIIYRLPPYFANINKQLVKSPKLYFIDVGLACYLLRIEALDQLAVHPLRGALVENLVVLELVKSRYNQGSDPNIYFYRDNQQHEVDIIYQQGHQLIPIEVKSSMTFHKQFFKNLDYFATLFPKQVQNSYVIYAGSYEQKILNHQLINYLKAATIVA